jgi:alkylation response protein AidB-like acyl-CoA dehydrogenase
MGFTLPYRFGGLNCPSLVYTMATDIVSRADTALMNIFGLQGIAETINAFATEEIKEEYLPGFCDGRYTGAMVLTEPDAGSDLQAVKVRAWQDENDQWRVSGVKRFITNGCGEILLVLARSEPDISDGRGLSLFLVERGEGVRIRRLEDKLGIHGSPTCEIQFNDAPAKLIGERQRGLITYVMSLMNGARIGIAAQSLGTAEAAYRQGRIYASSRRQFEQSIDRFPAVRELLVDMQLGLLASRSLTYETCCAVDREYGAARKLEFGDVSDKAERKLLKETERKYKRLAGMLTPMSKYYASEMCVKVTSDAMQILGGSGYMRDYPVERHYRDARITTIYEGTSQLQIVAAVRGVCGGTMEKLLAEFAGREWPDDLRDRVQTVIDGGWHLEEAIKFTKSRSGVEYMDYSGRRLVDAAINLYCGFLFLDQAAGNSRHEESKDSGFMSEMRSKRLAVADRWLSTKIPEAKHLCELVCSGEDSPLSSFDTLVGPPPEME